MGDSKSSNVNVLLDQIRLRVGQYVRNGLQGMASTAELVQQFSTVWTNVCTQFAQHGAFPGNAASGVTSGIHYWEEQAQGQRTGLVQACHSAAGDGAEVQACMVGSALQTGHITKRSKSGPAAGAESCPPPSPMPSPGCLPAPAISGAAAPQDLQWHVQVVLICSQAPHGGTSSPQEYTPYVPGSLQPPSSATAPISAQLILLRNMQLDTLSRQTEQGLRRLRFAEFGMQLEDIVVSPGAAGHGVIRYRNLLRAADPEEQAAGPIHTVLIHIFNDACIRQLAGAPSDADCPTDTTDHPAAGRCQPRARQPRREAQLPASLETRLVKEAVAGALHHIKLQSGGTFGLSKLESRINAALPIISDAAVRIIQNAHNPHLLPFCCSLLKCSAEGLDEALYLTCCQAISRSRSTPAGTLTQPEQPTITTNALHPDDAANEEYRQYVANEEHRQYAANEEYRQYAANEEYRQYASSEQAVPPDHPPAELLAYGSAYQHGGGAGADVYMHPSSSAPVVQPADISAACPLPAPAQHHTLPSRSSSLHGRQAACEAVLADGHDVRRVIAQEGLPMQQQQQASKCRGVEAPVPRAVKHVTDAALERRHAAYGNIKPLHVRNMNESEQADGSWLF